MSADRKSEADAIRRGLKQAMPALAAQLAPGGYLEGKGYWPVNPARDDRRPGSFVIDLYGETAGRFIDFACPDMKGDAIDLIALLVFGLTPPDGRRDKEVWAWARQFLSLPETRRAPPKDFAPAPRAAAPRPDEAKAKSAFGWWLKADDLRSGSAGWTYLTVARRIPLVSLRRPPGAIRTLRAMTYNRDDEAKGRVFAGLLTAMTDGHGLVKAVHRTFLREDGLGKAEVARPKQMWPSVKGLSIRLARGITGKTPEACARDGLRDDRLVLCEGIEDGLTWAALYPDDRVTAVGAFDLFRSAPLFDCAREILLVADNDAILKDGRMDRMALEVKARAGGRPVYITATLEAKDVNAAWQELAGAG